MARGVEGKIAVVSGAASGIGQAYARRLAEEGADVAVADVLPADKTAGLVAAAGRSCLALRCDVTSEESVGSFARATLERFGRVDILVNNAGVYPVTPFLEMRFDTWQKILAVNLHSVFLMCQAFLPGMRQRHWGRIVNIASGTLWHPPAGMAHYVAAKAGVVGLSRVLANEFGQDGVTVNCIAPGLVATQTVLDGPQGPWLEARSAARAIKRIQTPEDLVGTMAFLVSEDAAFLTGQTIAVDGGSAFL